MAPPTQVNTTSLTFLPATSAHTTNTSISTGTTPLHTPHTDPTLTATATTVAELSAQTQTTCLPRDNTPAAAQQTATPHSSEPVSSIAAAVPIPSVLAAATEPCDMVPQVSPAQSQLPLATQLPEGNLHIQYLEKIIRDSHEELRCA